MNGPGFFPENLIHLRETLIHILITRKCEHFDFFIYVNALLTFTAYKTPIHIYINISEEFLD